MKKYFTINNASMQCNNALSIPKGAVLTCQPVDRYNWHTALRENKHLFLFVVGGTEICKNVIDFTQAGLITLHPNNPSYPDTQLNIEAVTALYIVETVSWDVKKVA